MKKWKLLPVLAAKGIVQNGNVYYPYLVSAVFSVFTYFAFTSILHNDLIQTLPHSTYAWIMLLIGRVLLGIILLPFLYYANSFLIKRRKKELGLYSLLGLEKKHIGMMLFIEMLIGYGISAGGGILFGTVFSKLLFLLLLRLSSLPVDVEFVFTWKAVRETLVFFAAVFFFNFICSLIPLHRARPAELLSGSRKGEKEPRFLGLWTVAGLLALGAGYTVAVRAETDSMIFFNFFLAVFLVITGTYFLFTSGSVAFLRLMRGNRRIYYQPSNFITISGMYYRMKKSAAGLSNICIFSTMVIITLTCTITLYAGIDEITHYDYPYDIKASYDGSGISSAQVEEKAAELAGKCNQTILRLDSFEEIVFPCGKEGIRFQEEFPSERVRDNYKVHFITLEDYNRLSGEREELSDGQVIIYSTGADYNHEEMEFMGITAEVKKEIKELFPYPKEERNKLRSEFIVIVKDDETRRDYIKAWSERTLEPAEDLEKTIRQKTGIVLEGKDEGKKEFAAEFAGWCRRQTGFFMDISDGLEGRAILYSMNGGLLFIGIVFGLIFFMCLLLVMYYKQISEGYEDQGSFEIMRKVGMGDEEIQGAIRKQIFMVFVLPLAGSLVHASVGMVMVSRLMAALRMFDIRLLIFCEAGVGLAFIAVYGISYLTTSKSYYHIIK